MLKQINKSIQTQLNIQIQTLNKQIYRNIHTHFKKNAVYSIYKFQYGFHRYLHQIIDDTNYKWDVKYIKNNLRNLDKNLEWLKSLNSLERYISSDNDSGSIEDSTDLLVKLDVFNHVDRIEEGYTKHILNNYLESKFQLLETIIPLIPNTSIEFRKKYLLTNQFIQYLYRLISSNVKDINSKTLIKYFNFLLEIDISDVNDLLQRIYISIYNNLEKDNEDVKIDTRVKLLSKMVVKQDLDLDLDGLKTCVEEVLADCLCNSKVFYNNINETMQIIYSIYLYSFGISNTNSNYSTNNNNYSNNGYYTVIGNKDSSYNYTNINNKDYSDCQSIGIISSVDNYLELYVQKLSNYIYMFDNNTLINILYMFYKMNYMDDKLFNKVIESILFKFDSLSYEQMEALLTMLSTYKYFYMLNGGDLGDSLYGEGGKMLVGMMREYFESKLVNLQLTRMVDPLISLTVISKKNRLLKPLVLKKLDRNTMEQLSTLEFSKMLTLFSNLKIDKANEQVTRMIEKYVNNKLMIDLEKIEDKNRLIGDEMESILRQLSKFIPKKKYNKMIGNYVDKYLGLVDNNNLNLKIGSNSISNSSNSSGSTNISNEIMTNNSSNEYNNNGLIKMLRICLENKVYKYNNNETINKLLSRFISGISMGSLFTNDGSSSYISNGSGRSNSSNEIMTNSNSNISNINIKPSDSIISSFNINDNISNISYTNDRKYTDTIRLGNMDMDDMMVLLDSVDHSNMSLNNVLFISELVFKSIYGKIKGMSRLNLKHVYLILNYMVNTRIIDEELLRYLVEYVYDWHILTIPEVPKISKTTTKLIPKISEITKITEMEGRSMSKSEDNDEDIREDVDLEKIEDGNVGVDLDVDLEKIEELNRISNSRNNYKVGLYIMYLKCIKLLDLEMVDRESDGRNGINSSEIMSNSNSGNRYEENNENNKDNNNQENDGIKEYRLNQDNEYKEILENTYRYVVNHFNYSDMEYYLSNKNGKKVVENFRELLLFEKNNDYRLYKKIVEEMRVEVVEYLTDFSNVFKINSGKIYSKMMEKLDSSYSSYYEIEGIRYDFYSEKYNEGVHILKKEHYYG